MLNTEDLKHIQLIMWIATRLTTQTAQTGRHCVSSSDVSELSRTRSVSVDWQSLKRWHSGYGDRTVIKKGSDEKLDEVENTGVTENNVTVPYNINVVPAYWQTSRAKRNLSFKKYLFVT